MFEVVTDHSCLQYLLTIKDLNGRLARWSIYLQSYTFIVTHRAGRLHGNADALSRMVNSVDVVDLVNRQALNGDFDDTSLKTLDAWENDKLLFFLEHKRHLTGTTKQQVKYIARKAMHYVLETVKQPDDTILQTLYYFKDRNDFSTKRIVPWLRSIMKGL